MKLNELGHPGYLTDSSLSPIFCSEPKDKLHIQVLQVQEEVEEWKVEVSKLRAQHSWLLYFSIPKMLLLHKQITSSSPDIDAIVHEVSFIVYNQKIGRTKLRRGVIVRPKLS